MRQNYRAQALLSFIAFAFYPINTLVACLLATVLVDTILGSIMFYAVQNSILYGILFALITGASHYKHSGIYME